ncbi:hypothetical protein ACOJTA_09455 [Malaciobacter sp. WC5094]|uniref:hypothetical protein n=1 Tax=Arcobacter sp. YIC-80 TaxID=3376683 RepID=UPI00384C81EE
MKKIYSIVLLIAVALGFTACGGGGGSSSSFKNAIVDINVTCVASPSSNDFDTYITLYSGDKIVNDEPGTQVTTYHNINGEKKVCLVANSGKAHIVRK